MAAYSGVGEILFINLFNSVIGIERVDNEI